MGSSKRSALGRSDVHFGSYKWSFERPKMGEREQSALEQTYVRICNQKWSLGRDGVDTRERRESSLAP